jgi:hypothetical protein
MTDFQALKDMLDRGLVVQLRAEIGGYVIEVHSPDGRFTKSELFGEDSLSQIASMLKAA